MVKIRILLLSLFFLTFLISTALGQVRQEVASIGSENETISHGIVYTGLLAALNNYHFETIYLANEINLTADGELKAMEFYVSGGVTLSLLNDADVYLKTTGQSSLSNGSIANPAADGYTPISGTFTVLGLSVGGDDIVRFVLDDGFEVGQGENLAIHVRSSTVLGVSLGSNFYASNAPNLTRTGTALIVPIVNPNPTPNMEVRNLRPNVRLEFETEFTASAAHSIITAQQPQILADGLSNTLVTLQVRTATGENVNSGGDAVAFSTTNGTLSAVSDNGNGTYTATLTSAATPGTATVTATLNGAAVADNAQVQFVEFLSDLFCTDLEGLVIQTGNPTAAVTPKGPLYNKTASLTLGTYQFETLFLQTELGIDGPGFINSIDFFITDDINVNLLDGAQFYVKETSQTVLAPGSVSLADYTFVGGGGSLLTVNIAGSRRLRLNFSTPFFYSGSGNIALHSRHFVLADVNLGGEFHYQTADQNLTKASGEILNVGLLGGITLGLTSPQLTTERPIVSFDFGMLTTASLSQSTLSANPDRILADGVSTSTITSFIRNANGGVCVLQSGGPEFTTTAGTLGGVTHQGDGEYTALLTSSMVAEFADITANIDGSVLDEEAQVEFYLDDPVPSPAFTTITANPTSILANGSSTSQITVTLRDENDDPVTTGGFDVTLSTTAGTLGSITDNGNGTYSATLTSSTNEETATITGTLEGENITDTAQVVFFLDPPVPSPDFTTIEANPTSILANGSSTSQITVTLRDENDDPVTTGGFDVTLSTTAGTLGSITDNGDGTYTATLTSSTSVETAVITGTLEGDSINDSAEVDFTALPPSPAFTTITANPISIDADGASTSTVTVTLRNELNQPVGTGGFAVTLSTTAGTLGGVTDNGDGTYTATLTSSTNEETAVITGTLEGENIQDSAEVQFELNPLPPSPDFTTITANPSSILADGSSTSTVTVTLRNEDDELVGRGGFDVTLSTTAGTLGGVTDNGDGTYTATLTSSTNEETAVISGTLEGENIDDTAQVSFVLGVLPPSPDFTTITANPTSIAADGSSTSTITVTLRDENDDPVVTGGFDVTLSTTAGTLSGVTDNGDGTYTAILTSSTNEETAVITGTLEGEDITDTAEVSFVLGVLPPSPDFTTITANPTSIAANGSSTSTITVTLRDANNDPVTTGGFDVTLSTTAGTLGSITDNGNGTYTAILTSSTNEETAVITGTLEGEDIQDSAQVSFELDKPQPSPNHIIIEANPTELPADGESQSTIIVTLFDENNERITEGGFCQNISLATTDGTITGVSDNGDGTCTATLTSSTDPGTAIISGTYSGNPINDTAQVEFTVLPPDAATTTINAVPARLLADGESTSIITVILRNKLGNPVGTGGFAVTLSTTAGTLSGVTDNGNGTYTATLTSSTNEETAVITGTLEGVDIVDTTQVRFVLEELPPTAGNTTIDANPASIFANGVSTSTITVTLRDENNDPVGVGGYDVTLSTTAGTLGDITDNGDGTYTAMLTSSTTEETAVITGTLEGENIEDSAEVDFVLFPDADTTTITANPTAIDADGVSTSIITVTLNDSNGNPFGAGGFEVKLTSTAGTLGDVTDHGDGTYTATLTSSTTIGTAVITGTLEGDTINDSATVDFILIEDRPDIDYIEIIADPTEIPADGQSTSEIEVILYNSDGEQITDGGYCADISLNTTMGTLSDLTDNGDGTCSATLTSSTNPGTAVVSGTFEGDPIDDTAEIVFQSLDAYSCSVEVAYPNPFIERVTFRITSPGAGNIKLNLYDVLGKNVATVANQELTAGKHEIVFDGGSLSSGVYIYRLECPCSCASDTGRITRVGRN